MVSSDAKSPGPRGAQKGPGSPTRPPSTRQLNPYGAPNMTQQKRDVNPPRPASSRLNISDS